MGLRMAKRRITKSRLVRCEANKLPAPDPAELDRLAAMADADVDTSDLPEMDIAAMRQRTQMISLRLDQDVLRWFRQQGAGYQTRMRRVLRQYTLEQMGIAPQEQIVELVPLKGRGRGGARRFVMRRAAQPARRRA